MEKQEALAEALIKFTKEEATALFGLVQIAKKAQNETADFLIAKINSAFFSHIKPTEDGAEDKNE